MKKYLFLVATLLLTASMTMSAQNYGRRGGNRRVGMNNRRSEQMMRLTPQERVDLMTKELDLTAEEATKVLAMSERHEAERIADVSDNRSERGMGPANRDASREEFRTYRAEQMKKNQEELAKIIGKERADKWNDLRQDVRDNNRSGRVDGGRGYYGNNPQNIDNRRYNDSRRSEYMMRLAPQERVDLMTKELDLTAEQAAQVLELCEKQETERNAQVTEQRSSRGTGTVDRDARRDEFRAARDAQMKEHQEELVKIIGKEKADKWNELRQDVRDDNRAGRRNPRYRNR